MPVHRLGVTAIAAALGILLFAGSGCTADSVSAGEEADDAPTQTSADTTIGPVPAETTVTVGPYEMCLTEVRFLEDPRSGPDFPWAMPVPEGHLLATMKLRVANPGRASDEQTGPPMPALEGVAYSVDGAESVVATAVGVWRSSAARASTEETDATRSRGTALLMTQGILPGDQVGLQPQFAVPADTSSVQLSLTPLPERPDLTVVFTVK